MVEFIKRRLIKYQDKIEKIKSFLQKNVTFLQKIGCLKSCLNNKLEQQSRVKKRYRKLRAFLLAQARSVIAIKNSQGFQTSQQSNEMNSDARQSSQKILNTADEKQSFVKQQQFALLSQMTYKLEMHSPVISSIRTEVKNQEEKFL